MDRMNETTESDDRTFGFVDVRFALVTIFGAAAWQSLAGNPQAAATFAESGVLICLILAWRPAIMRLLDWAENTDIDLRALKRVDPVLAYVVATLATIVVTVLVFLIWGVKLWSVIP